MNYIPCGVQSIDSCPLENLLPVNHKNGGNFGRLAEFLVSPRETSNSLENKTNCFPRDQTLSVYYITGKTLMQIVCLVSVSFVTCMYLRFIFIVFAILLGTRRTRGPA